jgi:type IV pilus assembly protein PilC
VAGQTETVMQRLAEQYQSDVDDGIRRLVSAIEPTLVAVLSIVIGGILLSVMLPLASLMSSMG